MSFAFGALLTILLLLPGIAFRYAYIRSNSLRRNLDFSLLSEAIIMLVTSLLLHWVGMGLLRLLNRSVDFELIHKLVTGGALAAEDYVSFGDYYGSFVLYVVVLCGLAAALGYLLQRLVIWRGYEERYKVLRVFNDWDRYFTGYVLPPAQRNQLNFIRVDVLVDGTDRPVIYSGILENYSLNREQTLDQLYLSGAIRRELPDGPAGTEETFANYNLPGDYLVVPFDRVRNLNIVYNTGQQIEVVPTDKP